LPISDKLKLVFIHVPKNAGTAIENACAMRATGHKPWHVYKNYFSREWREYRSFGVVRDPVERFVSCYRYARMKRSYWHSCIPGDAATYGKHPDHDIATSLRFSDFVQRMADGSIRLSHPGWLPQYHWLCSNGLIMVGSVLRFSDLSRELARMGVSGVLRENKSEGTEDLRITSQDKEFIESLYRLDYNTFDGF
jgi:hypothetical protein